MPPEPPTTDPAPPAILRACGRLTGMNTEAGLALADELMASNPDFLCHALALAKLGLPMAKVDGVLRVALFLEVCHRELLGRPLPHFKHPTVARHQRETIQWLNSTGRIPETDHDTFRTEFFGRYSQIHVAAWVFNLLQQAHIIPPTHDDDPKLVAAAFTLLSLYSSAFPESPASTDTLPKT